MRKQRIFFLLIMCAVLVSLAIIGSSSWLIVNREQKQPVNQVNDDTSPCFTTEYTYDGATNFKPVLNDVGIAVFGEDAEFEITYAGGTPAYSGYYDGVFAAGSNAGTEAGTHRYKIVDKATGQVISNSHVVTVKQASVTLSAALTSVTDASGSANTSLKTLGAGFVGSTANWMVTVTGVNGTTVGTATTSYTIQDIDFDTFSSSVQDAGNAYSKTYTLTHASAISIGVTTNKAYLNNYDFNGECPYSGTVLPSCYSTNGTTKTYYGTLDQGLAKTVNSTATLIPPVSITAGSYTFNVKTNFTHKITANQTLGANVKLFIPYDTSESAVTAPTQITGTGACAYGNANLQLNEVKVSDGVILTANGTIHIPGQVSGSQNGLNGASLTTASHSQITLGENAKIEAYKNVYCYGFIAEASNNNGSGITMHSGNIDTVYTVIEHRGGTIFTGMIGGILNALNPQLQTSPFNRFFIRSVTSCLTVKSSATVTGYADLYASDKHNTTTIKLVGSTSQYLIQSASGTEIVTRFNTQTNQNELDIYGSATINSLSLTVQSATLSTKSVMFPLSYYWKVTLNKYDKGKGDNAVIDSTAQNIKLLPGSSLTVGEGVTLNVGTLAVYPEQTEGTEYLDLQITNANPYPYNETSAGVLNVAGTLNVANLGGTVSVAGSSAKVNITAGISVTSKELQVTGSSTMSDPHTYRSIALKANGLVATSSTTASNANLTVGSFVVLPGTNAWFRPTAYITFNPNGGAIDVAGTTVNVSLSGMTTDVSVLNEFKPSRADHRFVGWYLDQACTTPITASAIKYDTTVYAKWEEAVTATITYTGTNSGANFTEINWQASTALDEAYTVWVETINANEPKFQQYVSEWSAVWSIKYIGADGAETATTVNKTYAPGVSLTVTDIISEAGIDYDSVVECTCAMTASAWGTKNKVTITITDATVQVTDANATHTFTASDALYYLSGTSLAIEATKTKAEWDSISITGASVDSSENTITANITVNGAVTITAKSKDDESCFVAGTLITLVDGTQKAVEDLVVGDMVLVFNHVTGQIEVMPVIFNNHADQDAAEYDVLHLKFSNGEEVKIVASHGFFDMTLLQYVYITAQNYEDYIGHEFYYMDTNGNTSSVTLSEAFVQRETTRIFCPVTYFHMNSFANGFLNTPNIPGDITGLVNYFEYDPDLKYNEEKMQADIKKYGLYSYEDFKDYISEEAYNSSPAVYLKVSVGKGMMTYEEILDVIEYLLQGNLID